jgi:hypothetical protein
MPIQQFKYPTFSTNIPHIHQQTGEHPQQPTSQFLPTEMDTESDIEEESDTEMETTSKQPCQVLKKRQRSKLSLDAQQERILFQIETENRYEKLIQPSVVDALTYNTNKTTTNSENITINHKPPPIFIYGVTTYNQMV